MAELRISEEKRGASGHRRGRLEKHVSILVGENSAFQMRTVIWAEGVPAPRMFAGLALRGPSAAPGMSSGGMFCRSGGILLAARPVVNPIHRT